MKFFYILIVVSVLVIIAGATVWLGFFGVSKQTDVQEINTDFQVSEKSVALTIDYGEGNRNTFDAEFSNGMTAFNLLESEAEKSSINLKIKNYDMGVFIEAIGDKQNGQGGKYWLYYINGQMPSLSADKAVIKPGDKVEFKFEKSPS